MSAILEKHLWPQVLVVLLAETALQMPTLAVAVAVQQQ
jgi:hypothetical protein